MSLVLIHVLGGKGLVCMKYESVFVFVCVSVRMCVNMYVQFDPVYQVRCVCLYLQVFNEKVLVYLVIFSECSVAFPSPKHFRFPGMGSGLLLGRYALPVVQYIMKIFILCKLNLLPQCVSSCHISFILHGGLPVPLAVQFEPLPEPQGWGA